MYRFRMLQAKPLGKVQLSRLRKSVAHRRKLTRSDEDNCILCTYYKGKREHCVGCPAFFIYVSRPHPRKPRKPYLTLCEMYQRLSDNLSYPDGSVLPHNLFYERLLVHHAFLDALDKWLPQPEKEEASGDKKATTSAPEEE